MERDWHGRFIKGHKAIFSEQQLSEARKISNRVWLGRKATYAHRQKLIKALTGRKLTIETRKKLSESFKGKKAPNWQGGITKKNYTIRQSLEYKLWREAVFKRDNYTCVWCGQVGGKLNADHIQSFSLYPELRFAIDNGRTLCLDCHKKTPTYLNKSLKYEEINNVVQAN